MNINVGILLGTDHATHPRLPGRLSASGASIALWAVILDLGTWQEDVNGRR